MQEQAVTSSMMALILRPKEWLLSQLIIVWVLKGS